MASFFAASDLFIRACRDGRTGCDPGNARDAVRFGADGIVVSNHRGRQLDGVRSTADALPGIVDAVGHDLTVSADSGVRSGLDVIRMLALGARGVVLGRAYIYALAAGGQRGVANLLDLVAKEMRVAMTLTGARTAEEITRDNLVKAAELRRGVEDAAFCPAAPALQARYHSFTNDPSHLESAHMSSVVTTSLNQAWNGVGPWRH